MAHASPAMPPADPLEVGKLPAPGHKIHYVPEAHPVTDVGFDDRKTWFKNTVQRDQVYMQKRNLPTHRVMPADRIWNGMAYGLGAVSGAASVYCLWAMMSKKYPPL